MGEDDMLSNVEVKDLVRTRGPHQPRHPLLPHPIITFTHCWLDLDDGLPPAFAAFDMIDVVDVVPYLTILKRTGEGIYTIDFAGSAIAALSGEDPTGKRVTRGAPAQGDVNWFERCEIAIAHADMNVSNGVLHPPQTSSIDYVSADFPFRDDDGALTHVICVTVPKLN